MSIGYSGIGQPQPAEPLLPDPEPAEHRPGDPRRSGARSTSPATARSIRRRSWCRTRSSRRPGRSLPFAGALGQRTIARQNTLFPYPLLSVERRGQPLGARPPTITPCAARQPPLRGRLDARCELHLVEGIDNTDTVEDNQGFNAGGSARGDYHMLDPTTEPAPGYSDMPHRFVGDVPLRAAVRQGRRSAARTRALSAIAGGWQIGGIGIWQTGFPIAITGASIGAALARPDRVEGVDLLLPENLLGLVRRPDVGDAAERPVDHAAGEHLSEVQPRRVRGRVVTTPNGRIVADQFWYGDAAHHLRRDPDGQPVQHRHEHPAHVRFAHDDDARPRRRCDERPEPYAVQRRLYGRSATRTSRQSRRRAVPGMGNSNSYGTRGMATYNPRQIQLRAALRF